MWENKMEYRFADENDKTEELDQEAKHLAVDEGEDPEEETRKVKIIVYAHAQAYHKLSTLESVVKEALEDLDEFVGVEDVTVNET